MGNAISKLTIKGYKSIRSLENFELQNINILIGPNGSGKSNFLSFFRLLEEISKGEDYLQRYVKYVGGADKLLYLGTKETSRAEVDILFFDANGTRFYLKVTQDYKLEYVQMGNIETTGLDDSKRSPYLESKMKEIYSNYKLYHFNDTSDLAGVKRPNSEGNFDYLFPDGSNLAPFLFRLKSKQTRDYQAIIDVIRLAAPFFNDFKFDINEQSGDVKWWWSQKGSDYQYHPSQISDGTLRFICLATALLQPNPPSTILLDEPELGLHPMALKLFSDMVKKASLKTQIIIATQSASLISHFAPEDIVIVERKNEESVFRRLPLEKLKQWLDDYSLGELWEMHLLEGRPENE